MNIVFSWDSASALWAFVATFAFGMMLFLRFVTLKGGEDNEKRRLSRRISSKEEVAAYRSFSRSAFARNWAITWVVLFALGSGVSWLVTSSSEPDRPAMLNDAIGEYGLQNGAPYPLYLGGTQNSLTGTAFAQASIFSSSAVIDLKPTTVVNIGFEHSGLWWPLALPADRSPFKVTEGDPSVNLWFHNVELDRGEAYWNVTWSDCTPELHNLWLVCVRTVEEESLLVEDAWRNQTIPDFFETYFERAQIDLTPEQHAVLFPAN